MLKIFERNSAAFCISHAFGTGRPFCVTTCILTAPVICILAVRYDISLPT